MNTGTLLWIIIFAISATIFFVVAAVVAVKGFGDLRDLLGSSRPGQHDNDAA